MPRIAYRLISTVAPPLPADGAVALRVVMPLADARAEVTIDDAGETVTVAGEHDTPPDVAESLRLGRSAEEFGRRRSDQFQEILAAFRRARDRILGLITQELSFREKHAIHGEAADFLMDGTWRRVAFDVEPFYLSLRFEHVIRPHLSDYFQELIDADEMPLLAWEYVAEAKRPGTFAARWIAASTAAEIAIKEILSRFEPKLRRLLLEVPSPPIEKLYGPILEEVTGEASKYAKVLKLGAQKRNQLVHRAEQTPPTGPETEEYIRQVEEAIRDLLCRQLHRKRRILPAGDLIAPGPDGTPSPPNPYIVANRRAHGPTQG